MRYRIKKNISRELFRKYARKLGMGAVNLEMMFDRLCVRKKDFGSIGAESWHRDIYDGPKYNLRKLPNTLDGSRRDEIFGGWVNLSDKDQEFVGLVKTHRGAEAKQAQAKGGGFATIDPNDKAYIKSLDVRLKAQANTKYSDHLITNSKGHIVVPPGHMIVFLQRILHSVLSSTPPEDPSLRLFVGHRLTKEEVPLFADLPAVVTNGMVPRIPSGQVPPMYSANHYAFFSKEGDSNAFRDWGGQTFVPEALFQRVVSKTGKRYFTPGSKDNRNIAANKQRSMPSLAEMNMHSSMYAYNERDITVLTPEKLI